MSTRHLRRTEILTHLVSGKISTLEAAQLLGLTTRQTRRLRHRFTGEGVAAVVQGNTGRAPANRTDPALVCRLRQLCGVGGTYHDFNVSHLQELLARDEDLHLPRSTLARLLLKHAIRPTPPPRHEPKRTRRERRSREGALLQLDGSPHDWLEGRGPRMGLVAAIDDATGKIVYASFRPAEDQSGYLLMLRSLAQQFGLPEALYHDRHTILRSPKEPTIEEELSGQRPMSHVQAVPADFDLGYYFATRTERSVRRDHTLQWLGRCLQIVLGKVEASLAGKRVRVHVTPEGAVLLYAGARRLTYREVEVEARRPQAAPRRVAHGEEGDPEAKAAAQARRRGWLFTAHP